jgi:phosphoinositide-3-kinase, regulatory subunit 4
MGNKIARTTQASATEYYLHDLPSTYNLVLLDVVSRGRFLKSVRCKHDEGLLLVKVYFKRAGEPIDLKVSAATLSPPPSLHLARPSRIPWDLTSSRLLRSVAGVSQEHERRLERIRNAFKGIEGSHVWPFQVRIPCLGLLVLIQVVSSVNPASRLRTGVIDIVCWYNCYVLLG